MKQLFVIGGMGAGKSTVCRALADQGLELIDLDRVGHAILRWGTVKEELVDTFGADIIDENGEVDRSKLAAKAFISPSETRKLNRITMPRIEERYTDMIEDLERQGVQAVVVEYSAFKNRQLSIADHADVIIAVVADRESRVKRAVAAGFDEVDVRHRIARQISDSDRIEAADVVFRNDGSQEQLYRSVVTWWNSFPEL